MATAAADETSQVVLLNQDQHEAGEEEQQQEQQQLDDMDTLIENQHWDQVTSLLQASPEQAQRIVNPSLGWTKLHWLCSLPNTPTQLIDLVARLYPQAITMPDNRYGDTPLHIICRNSVTNAIKLRILLSHMNIVNDHTTTTNNSSDSTTLPSQQQQQQQQQQPSPIPNTHEKGDRGGGSSGRNSGNFSGNFSGNSGNDGLLIRNRFGATALHSACNHNAVLDVIQALIEADARIVRVTTHDGIHAISALYSGYVQTIPGTMAVAHILRGESLEKTENDQNPTAPIVVTPVPSAATTATVTTNEATATAASQQQEQEQQQHDPSPAAHFDRFWKKVEYLATAVYTQAKNNSAPPPPPPSSVENSEEEQENQCNQNHDHALYNKFVVHGLLQSHGVSLQFYQLALQCNPLYAQVMDTETGNLPLHVLVERRPFRLYERQAIQFTLRAYPQAATIRNDNGNGDLPLVIAIRNKIPWHNGLDLIAAASPSASSSAIAGGRDTVTGLWPFQLAASIGGKVAVETTFELLKNQPDLLLSV